MKKINKFFKNSLVKYGHVIVGCAMAFVVFAANTQCMIPYYEPEEPNGLEKFKKFNK